MKKHTSKLFVFLSCLIAVLVLVQLVLSNSLVSEGSRLKSLQGQIANLEEENNKLKGETASLFSLSKLTEHASKKGFVKPSEVVNLSSKIPVAVKPSLE
jgi:cell division protein FtsB